MNGKFLKALLILFLLLVKVLIYSEVYSPSKLESLGEFLNRVFPSPSQISIRIDLFSLFSAYPKNCIYIKINSDKKVFVILDDKTKIIYDDGKIKSFNDKLNDPDIHDMLDQLYIPGKVKKMPQENFDPGRLRIEKFFRSIYGQNRKETLRNCVNVVFSKKKVKFNKKNKAAAALNRVRMELNALLKEKPNLKKYILPISGTFNWRVIAGTNRLSPHSFGIAIDLNSRYGYYWRWETPGVYIKKKIEEYPFEIIDIFEKNGFIWGGKWFHYDLMHFEYRPELLLKYNYLRILMNYKMLNFTKNSNKEKNNIDR